MNGYGYDGQGKTREQETRDSMDMLAVVLVIGMLEVIVFGVLGLAVWRWDLI
jgi:hypothetical protein